MAVLATTFRTRSPRSGKLRRGIAPLLARTHGSTVGLLLGIWGAGATATAVILVLIGGLPRAGFSSSLLVLVMAASLGLLGCAPSVPATVAAAAGLGIGSGFVGATMMALLQASTPPGYLGRLASLSMLSSYGGVPLSFALTGTVTDAWGAPEAFGAGALIATAGGVLGLLTPAFRRAVLPRPARRRSGQPARRRAR